jgi:hypothetical protein
MTLEKWCTDTGGLRTYSFPFDTTMSSMVAWMAPGVDAVQGW